VFSPRLSGVRNYAEEWYVSADQRPTLREGSSQMARLHRGLRPTQRRTRLPFICPIRLSDSVAQHAQRVEAPLQPTQRRTGLPLICLTRLSDSVAQHAQRVEAPLQPTQRRTGLPLICLIRLSDSVAQHAQRVEAPLQPTQRRTGLPLICLIRLSDSAIQPRPTATHGNAPSCKSCRCFHPSPPTKSPAPCRNHHEADPPCHPIARQNSQACRYNPHVVTKDTP